MLNDASRLSLSLRTPSLQARSAIRWSARDTYRIESALAGEASAEVVRDGRRGGVARRQAKGQDEKDCYPSQSVVIESRRQHPSLRIRWTFCPAVTIVIVHSGGYFAWQAGRLKHARRVRAELASTPEDPWAYVGQIKFDCLTHDRQALAYLLSRVGPENVLMGTDLPCDMASAQPWEDLRAVTDEATALQVAGENIERVFGLAPAVTPQVSGEPR